MPCRIPVSGGSEGPAFALVDTADYEALAASAWWLNHDGYAVTMRGGRHIRMHRLVAHRAGIEQGSGRTNELDHANRDRLDNRRANLRAVTRQEQLRNRRGWGKLAGKGYAKRGSRYQARIKVDGRLHAIGMFTTAEAAMHAYDCYARLLFGEHAALNDPAAAWTVHDVEAARGPQSRTAPLYKRLGLAA